MKNFKIIILLLVVTPILHAQKWEKVNAPYSYHYNPPLGDIHYPNITQRDNIIYAIPIITTKDYILHYSTDDGLTWLMTDTTVFHQVTGGVRSSYPEFTNTAMFNAVRGKLFRSDDKGKTWKHIDLFPIRQNLGDSALTRLSADEDNVIARTTAGAIFASTDNGDHWFKMPIPDEYTYGAIGIIGNYMIYDGKFTDGKYYETRFNKIPDIRNPIVQKLSYDFPRPYPSETDKQPGFYPCNTLSNCGSGLKCDGTGHLFLQERWNLDYPLAVFKDDNIEYFPAGGDNGIKYGRMYSTETPNALFQVLIVHRKPDSAKVFRVMRLAAPYTGEFEKWTEDLIIEKSNPDYAKIVPKTIAQTESGVLLHTSTGYYRYSQLASSAIEEENNKPIISVQPQPSKEGSTITFSSMKTGSYTITLIDPLGARIGIIENNVSLQKGQSHTKFIESNTLSSGLYTIIVQSDNVTLSAPFIVIR